MAIVDSALLATAIRNELVAAGLVRRPSSDGAAPPLHVEPRGGAPAPGASREDARETAGELVATLRLGLELGAGPGAHHVRRFAMDLVLRSSSTAGLRAGRDLDARVRALLVEAPAGDGYLLDAAGARPVYVLSCYPYAGLGPVADVDGIRTERSAYVFEVGSE